MKRYGNWSGTSGIMAYDYNAEGIDVQFRHGGTYRYTSSSMETHPGAGAEHLQNMKRLADRGSGLNAYINRYARELYECRVE